MIRTPSVLKRFWAKGRVNSRRVNGCWVWTAGRSSGGRYGSFYLNGKMEQAHRAAWIIFRGPIPKGKCVCHTCDNTICIRPSHLFLGTQAQNVADMMRKGRRGNPISPAGSKHPESKLNERQVAAIRRLYATGRYSQRALADRFWVTVMVVNKIVRRKSWKHVA